MHDSVLVAVTDFGSVWRRRYGKNLDDPRRFAKGVYYNTTGINIAGAIRQRPQIVGYARFNGCGGFNPNRPSQMIGRVFECAEPCLWHGQNKLLFKCLLNAPEKPDAFLVVVRAQLVGKLTIGRTDWRSAVTWLIFVQRMSRPAGGHALDAVAQLDTNRVGPLRPGAGSTASMGCAACAGIRVAGM